MNYREMFRIAAALSVGALVIAIPWRVTRVSLGPTTPGTIEACDKLFGDHVGGKATKLFRITVSNFAELGKSGSFKIEEDSLDANEMPMGTLTPHKYSQSGDEPGNVTPLDLALGLESTSDPANGKHKKVMIEIINMDMKYPFRGDEFVIVPIGEDSEKMLCDYSRSSITSNVVRFRAHFKKDRFQKDRKYGKYLIGVFTPYGQPAPSPGKKPIKVPIFIDPMIQNYG